MKTIRIRKLQLENFKCHTHLEITFEGETTSIYGDNATGKSTIYDGLTWLLFGKDSRGSSDAETIKPLGENGQVKDHQAITAVEAELAVTEDDATRAVTLRRSLKEVWASKRGSSTQEYGGNISEYAVDGVPTKKNGFDAAVKALFGESLYRVLTDVRYFAEGMKWQERRNILFDMAGHLTDEQIMLQEERFWILKDQGLDLESLKKKLLAERKQLVGARDSGPARMSECQKLIDQFSGQDFAQAKKDSMMLGEKAAELQGAIRALRNGSRAKEIGYQLREKEAEKRALEAQNQTYREKQAQAGGRAKAEQTKAAAEDRLQYTEKRIQEEEDSLRYLEHSLESYRTEWIQVNGESFSGGKCPTCGQSLPFEQLKAKTEAFEGRKKERLATLEGKAGHTKQMLEERRGDLGRLREEQEALKAAIAEAEKALAAAPMTEARDMPEYEARMEALSGEIVALEQERLALETGEQAQEAALVQELSGITEQLKEAQQRAAEEGSLLYARGRLAELRQEAQEAAAKLEQAEKLLNLIEDFTRYKAGFLESTVNAPFRLAKFRLFKEQANGGVEARCDVTVDGVPYSALNSAMQINVGLDIIDALSDFYGVRVPLFIDNAESVTQLEAMNSQVIRLVVSENDKELKIV